MFSRAPQGEVKALTESAIPILKADGEPDLPSITTPVVGWRAWQLSWSGGLLHSLSANGYGHGAASWPARRTFVATCHREKDHISPGPGCSCGIYAGKTELQITPSAAEMVWGQVALWGRVLEQDDVYRAQFAYPVRLIYINRARTERMGDGNTHTTPKLTVKELAKKLECISLYYGVPVESSSYDDFAAAQSRCYGEMGIPDEVKGLINV